MSASKKIPIGIQLYCIRKECEKDLPGSLKAVADMGYDGVEFAGYYGREASELQKMLDDLGLKVAGTHLKKDQLVGDGLKETVEFNKVLGNRNLVIAHLSDDHFETPEGCAEVGRMFGQIARKVEPEGMRTGYHNHTTEFVAKGDSTIWDLIADNSPESVIMQFDVGNAMHGGAQPMPFLRRHPGRTTSLHVKDYSSTDRKVIVGEGEAPWKEIFDFCQTQGGTEWYVVEQETHAYPPLECAKRCIDNLRAMGL